METNLLMCNCAGSQWVTLERTNGQEIEGRAGESESEILRTLMLCCEILLGWFSRSIFVVVVDNGTEKVPTTSFTVVCQSRFLIEQMLRSELVELGLSRQRESSLPDALCFGEEAS